MKAAIFKILLPGPIKTYDKPLLTFWKNLLASLWQASFDVYELTEHGIRVLFIIIIIIIIIVIIIIIIIITIIIIIKCGIW